jgi:hypothetical protein
VVWLVVTERLQTIPGVKDTYTLITFNAFQTGKSAGAARAGRLSRPDTKRLRSATVPTRPATPRPSRRLAQAPPSIPSEVTAMRRILTAITLSAALATAACQNPDGSTDWGSTLLLGAGAGVAAAAVAGAVADDNHHDRGHYRRYDRGPQRYGYNNSGYRGGRPAYRY